MMTDIGGPVQPGTALSSLRARVRRLEDRLDGIGRALFDAMVAVAKPGDTVILAFGRSLTDEDIEHLEEAFKPLKEHGIEVAFTDQVEAITVVRPDDDEDINDRSDA
jgi:hypothetical protein